MLRCGEAGVGVEPEELDRLVVLIDVGMLREAVRAEQVGGSRLLHADLRAVEGEAAAVDGEPDLFFAGQVRVGLAQLEGIDLHRDDVADGGEAILGIEEVAHDVRPMAACAGIGVGARGASGLRRSTDGMPSLVDDQRSVEWGGSRQGPGLR